MRIFENSDIQFINARRTAYVVSAVLLIVSLISLATRGLELGIDFQGGMEFVVESETPLNPVQVRSELGAVLGAEPEVKTFGANQLLIRTHSEGETSVVQASGRHLGRFLRLESHRRENGHRRATICR